MLIEAIAGTAISNQGKPMDDDEAARIVREYVALSDTTGPQPVTIPFAELPGEAGTER